MRQTTVRVRLFSSPTARSKKGIAVEVERLNAFLNSKVVVTCDKD